MSKEVEHQLLKLLRDELDWDGAPPTGRLDEHFDSLQLMSLVVAVEDTFEVILEPEDEEKIETASDLIEIIAAKLKERA